MAGKRAREIMNAAGAKKARKTTFVPAKASSYLKVKKDRDVQWVGGRLTTGPQGPEIKTLDLTATAQNITSAAPAVISLLATIAQGTGSTNRVGDRIKVKSVNLKINASNTTTGVCFYRWSLVLDKNPDNSTATIGSIFTNSSTNNTQLTVANLDRFQVLRTGRTEVAISSNGPVGQNWDEYLSSDIGVRFPDATGEATSNALYLVITCSGTSASYLIDYDVRVRFTDE